MECKSDITQKAKESRMGGIEPYWNVNVNVKVAPIAVGKGGIEPYWNVNKLKD